MLRFWRSLFIVLSWGFVAELLLRRLVFLVVRLFVSEASRFSMDFDFLGFSSWE